MDKYTFYAVTERDKNGDFFSYVVRIRNNENLLYYICNQDILTFSACDSKKSAEDITNHWNDVARDNRKLAEAWQW